MQIVTIGHWPEKQPTVCSSMHIHCARIYYACAYDDFVAAVSRRVGRQWPISLVLRLCDPVASLSSNT